ncbi:MAG: Usg family protein [Magnetovibrio sp.]|nr:Usg family protein [Magnetovibrio sp.]
MTLARQLRGYRLTTADITYRRPDFPDFLQSYIWQELDKAPDFPVLMKFLKFWETNLDGELHSVRVACAELIKPAEFRWIGSGLRLH